MRHSPPSAICPKTPAVTEGCSGDWPRLDHTFNHWPVLIVLLKIGFLIAPGNDLEIRIRTLNLQPNSAPSSVKRYRVGNSPPGKMYFPTLAVKNSMVGVWGKGWWMVMESTQEEQLLFSNSTNTFQTCSNNLFVRRIMYSILFMANNTWRQHVHVTDWILQTSCWLALFPVYPMFVLYYGTFAIPKVQPQAGEQVAKTGATVDEIPHLVL